MMNALYNILINHAVKINSIEWLDLANIDPDTGFVGVITQDTVVKFSYTIDVNGAKVSGSHRAFAVDICEDLEDLVYTVIDEKVELLCKEIVLSMYGIGDLEEVNEG